MEVDVGVDATDIVKVLLVKLYSDEEPTYALLEITPELQLKLRMLRDVARDVEKKLHEFGTACLYGISVPGTEPDLFNYDEEMDAALGESELLEVSFEQNVLLREGKEESENAAAGELVVTPLDVHWVCWMERSSECVETAPITYGELGIED